MTSFCKIGFSSVFFFFSNRAYNIEHFSILERLFWPIINRDFIPPPIFLEKIWKIKKTSRICNFSIENPVIFCHFWGQKYTSISIDFSVFWRDFERIFDILPYYTDVFSSSIFDFFPKKQIFKTKSLKKLKVQKWCQNGSNSII